MEIEYIRIKRFNLDREKAYATGTDAIHCCLIPVSYTHLKLKSLPKNIFLSLLVGGVSLGSQYIAARYMGAASDLVYHLIVLLTSKGLRLEDLARELKKRHKG